MKVGRTLTELAVELERQAAAKRDFVASTAALELKATDDNKSVQLALKNQGQFNVSEVTHGQLAAYTGVPKQYYDRMRSEDPSLLAMNVNRWMHDNEHSRDKRMVRTIDGRARAFLSDRYRPLDNWELATAILPTILSDKQMRIESCELTENRMYIKVATERLTRDVKVGEPVQAGAVISNSEVGLGMVKIEPMILVLRCLNGAISADSTLRKYHVGRGKGDMDFDVSEFFKDSTREADDKAFFLKVRDVFQAAFSEALFTRLVNKMSETFGNKITADPIEVIDITAKRYNLNDTEKGSVLRQLIAGADLSQYGLMNAVTAAAQDKDLTYERATELERIGGDIIELAPSDWKLIGSKN
jgi:hypothetical protein